MSRSLDCNALIHVFNHCFYSSHQTKLVGGADEPLYQPADTQHTTHRIYFRADYASSALHEAAHWCIAGDKRRTQVDYGYWYTEDGRTQAQQAEFEKMEIKPQAIEQIFSHYAGITFHISADNLTGDGQSSVDFKQAVQRLFEHYLAKPHTLPPRARIFAEALVIYKPSASKP